MKQIMDLIRVLKMIVKFQTHDFKLRTPTPKQASTTNTTADVKE